MAVAAWVPLHTATCAACKPCCLLSAHCCRYQSGRLRAAGKAAAAADHSCKDEEQGQVVTVTAVCRASGADSRGSSWSGTSDVVAARTSRASQGGSVPSLKVYKV